jgi:hypothetical protein
LNIYEKLLEIQKSIDKLAKGEENKTDKYKYVGSETVIESVRGKMNELGLLLIPEVTAARVIVGETKSGTTRFFTELDMLMTWVNTEKLDEKLPCKWYAQGVDLAGEKGVGKAQTYAEKYFILKFFHIPTAKDDPDNDGRNADGKKPTTVRTETAHDCRNWSVTMLDELCGGDAEKVKTSVNALTRFKMADGTTSEGVESMEDISEKAVPIVYARLKEEYKKKFSKDFKHGIEAK